MVAANSGKPPGFLGVLRITARVLSRSSKHFLYLSAFLLLIPFALFSAFAPIQQHNTKTIAAFVAQISALVSSTASSEYKHNPSDDVAGQQPRSYVQTLPIVLSVGFTLFTITVTTPALTVSVCRGYLNKDLCIKSSLRALPQLFFRVLLTFVCLTAAFFGVVIISSVVAVLIGALIIILLRVRDLRPLVTVLASALGAVGMIYFAILWSLAGTVTILEQQSGWQALSRSAYLMKGRKRVGLRLGAFFDLCFIFVPIFICEEAPSLARFSVAAVSIVIWSLLSLINKASTVIFYLSCVEFHNESPEMLSTTTKSALEHTSAAYTKLNSPTVESSFIVGDI